MLRVVEEAARTDTGRQRYANEDSYFARSPVYAIADGMGGAQAGEVASKIAADAFDEPLSGERAEQALAERARDANRRIHELARKDESRSGMGTTLTAAALDGDQVSIAHVGDSRAYLYRDGKLRQLTRDHSLVEELRRQGRLTSEEAEEHPQRSIITRALGPDPDVEPDVHSHQARPDDVYLLCSDGLTSMVREPEIEEILAGNASLQAAVNALVVAANDAGGRDNITVVCFRLGGDTAGGIAGARGDDVAGDAEDGDLDKTITDLNVSDLEVAPVSELEPTGPVRKRAAAERRPGPKPERRWRRRVVSALVVFGLLGAAAFGIDYGLKHVYFIGQNDQGLVSMYRGLPYELPGGIKLYKERYVSSVPTRGLSAVQRQRLLDHQLRSRAEAAEVVKRLERGDQGR